VKNVLINSDGLFLALIVRHLLNNLLHDGSVPARVDAGKGHVEMWVALNGDSLLGIVLRDILKDLGRHKGSSVLKGKVNKWRNRVSGE